MRAKIGIPTGASEACSRDRFIASLPKTTSDYADTFDTARANFAEAVASHFEALEHFGKLAETVTELRTLADSRTFWEDRVKPRETVERFSIPAPSSTELSAA